MRILWWGVAPWSASGYGKTARYLIPELVKLGHELAIHPIYGAQGGQFDWQGVPVYAYKGGNPPNKSAYLPFAMSDFKPDVVLTHMDLWETAGIGIPRNTIVYSPVDCQPLPSWAKDAIGDALAVVPLCSWAAGVYAAAGIATMPPIYHGVDTSIYKPGDKAAARALFGWPQDGFVVLANGTNSQDNRKNLSGLLQGFQTFLNRTRSDAYLALWTYPKLDAEHPACMDLERLWAGLGGNPTRLRLPPARLYDKGLSEPEMAMLYQGADILAEPSFGEGFGYPVLEAMACGVPVVASDNSALSELVGEQRGWLVYCPDLEPVPALGSWWRRPDTAMIASTLQNVWADPEERRNKGGAGLMFARAFSWPLLASQWDGLLRELEPKIHRRIFRAVSSCADHPEAIVDIVIPCRNHVELTRACVESIAATVLSDYTPYHLILVDDASTDDTPEYLRTLAADNPLVTAVLSQAKLASFAQSVNIGVGQGQAPYILLLNNDVVARTDGWLESMLGHLQADDGIGLVGAKLLYPDGLLQHAGIIFRNGVPAHRGRDGPADTFAECEDVPAVTFACALTWRELWGTGLDEAYEVGTCEDVDFNLSLRSLGYRVVYCADAVLEHREGASIYVDGGLRNEHVAANRALLQSRWLSTMLKLGTGGQVHAQV